MPLVFTYTCAQADVELRSSCFFQEVDLGIPFPLPQWLSMQQRIFFFGVGWRRSGRFFFTEAGQKKSPMTGLKNWFLVQMGEGMGRVNRVVVIKAMMRPEAQGDWLWGQVHVSLVLTVVVWDGAKEQCWSEAAPTTPDGWGGSCLPRISSVGLDPHRRDGHPCSGGHMRNLQCPPQQQRSDTTFKLCRWKLRATRIWILMLT